MGDAADAVATAIGPLQQNPSNENCTTLMTAFVRSLSNPNAVHFLIHVLDPWYQEKAKRFKKEGLWPARRADTSVDKDEDEEDPDDPDYDDAVGLPDFFYDEHNPLEADEKDEETKVPEDRPETTQDEDSAGFEDEEAISTSEEDNDEDVPEATATHQQKTRSGSRKQVSQKAPAAKPSKERGSKDGAKATAITKRAKVLQGILQRQRSVDRVNADITVLHVLQQVEGALDAVRGGCNATNKDQMLRVVARMFSTQALVDFRRWSQTTLSYYRLYQATKDGYEKKWDLPKLEVEEFNDVIAALAEMTFIETTGANKPFTVPQWMESRNQLYRHYHALTRRIRKDVAAFDQLTAAFRVHDPNVSDSPNLEVRMLTFEEDMFNLVCSRMLPAGTHPERHAGLRRTLQSDLRIGSSLRTIASLGGRGVWHMLDNTSIRTILAAVPSRIVEATFIAVLNEVRDLMGMFDPIIECITLPSSEKKERTHSLGFELLGDPELLGLKTRRDHTMSHLLRTSTNLIERDFANRQDDPSFVSGMLYDINPKALEDIARKGKLAATTTNPQASGQLRKGTGIEAGNTESGPSQHQADSVERKNNESGNSEGGKNQDLRMEDEDEDKSNQNQDNDIDMKDYAA